ncbi:MAG: hypothetical protein K6F57_04575 [Candidatus Saccharibacteria bacterium]|nr:hypothetical protein [Candidatus Saccharibacteria bacterium]
MRIEEGILRAKCVAAIDDELSIGDLESAIKIIRECGCRSCLSIAKMLHVGAYRSVAIFNQLERIGVVSVQSFNFGDRMFHPEKAMDGFEKIILSVKSTNIASRRAN